MIKRGIWVVCVDIQHEMISFLQLMNKAYDLARLRQVHSGAVCIGNMDEAARRCLAENGAEFILSAEYKGSQEAEMAEIVKQMIKCYEPEMILFLGNPVGRYLASVCSVVFEAALTADCIDISLSDDGDYIFSRAALNDSVIANIKAVNSNLKLCTVKKNSFQNRKDIINKDCQVMQFVYTIQKQIKGLEILESTKKPVLEDNIDWQNAKIVFAVGRGVPNHTYLDYIYELAGKYNAVVVGTRAAVESGMIEDRRQVGQSGYSICSNIYVGFGVSGACQHIVGIKNAKVIIAINKDEKAPIFDYADYKIVNTVEACIDEWRKLK